MANLQFIISTNAAGGIAGIQQYNQALQSVGTTANTQSAQATSAFDRIEAVLNKAKSAVIGFVAAMAFAKMIQGFREVIDAGIEFEASFAGIRKVVDGSESDFNVLRDQFRQLAKEIPIAVTELNKIGQLGGQLGVPAEKLTEFTSVIAKFSTVSDMASDEAATMFSQFSNSMRTSIDDTKVFASVVFELGRKSNATEKDILTLSMNLAAAGKLAGMNSSQVAALATTLAGVGLHAEKAGSAMSRIIQEMSKNIAMSTPQVAKFAQVAGVMDSSLNGTGFATLFSKKPAEAILAFFQGLEKLNKSGQNILPILDNLGIKNVRVIDVVGRTALAAEDLARNLKLAADESTKSGAALEDGFGKRASTVDMQLQLLKNRLNDVEISLSMQLLPTVISVSAAFVNFAEALREHAALTKSVIEVVSGLVAAWAAFKTAQIIAGFSGIREAVFAYNAVMAGAATVTEGFVFALKGLALLTAVTADIILLINLLNKYNQYKEDSNAIAEGGKLQLELENKARQVAIAKLKEHNATLDTTGMSLEQINKLLIYITPQWLREADAVKKASVASADHTEKINIQSAAQKKLQEAQDKAIASMISMGSVTASEVTIMDKSLGKLTDAHADADLVIKKLGKQILETRDALKEEGREIPSNISAWVALIDAQKSLAESLKASSVLVSSMITPVGSAANAMLEMRMAANDLVDNGLTPESKAIGESISWLEKYDAILKRIPLSAGSLRESMKTVLDVTGVTDPSQITASITQPGVMDERPLVDFLDEGEKIIKSLKSSAGHIFDDLVQNGTNVFKSLGDLAKGIFQTIGRTIFQEMVEGLFEPFKKKLGELSATLQEQLGKAISWAVNKLAELGKNGGIAIIGGAAVGGAVGGTRGAIAGGLAGAALGQAMAGDPIGAAILAVASLGVALSGLFGNLHKQANKFVQEIQNPMTKAVSDLFTSLEAAKSSGELTVKQVTEAKTAFEGMWKNFQAEAAKTGVVGEQAMNTMTPFIASWRTWLDSLETAATDLERAAALKSITDKVTTAADGFDTLEAAIGQLMATGMDWGPIIKYLGGDIKDMADRMRVFGLAIPPAMQAILDAIDTMDMMAKAATRLDDVKKELEDVTNQLGEALITKLNLIDSSVADSKKSIEDWNKTVKDNTKDIDDTQKHLEDAAFWQDRYNDSIRDAENALKSATDKRKSIENQIADLQVTVTRDHLQSIIDNSYDEMQIAEAQAALDLFNREQKKKEILERIQQLSDLQAALIDAKKSELEAIDLLIKKKSATDAQIASERDELSQFVASKKKERAELLVNIATEQDRIDKLELERGKVVQLMDAMGAARLTEMEKIDKTIETLIRRGTALEQEQAGLEKLIGLASTLNNRITNLSTLPPVPPATPSGPRVPTFDGTGPNGTIVQDTPFGPRTIDTAANPDWQQLPGIRFTPGSPQPLLGGYERGTGEDIVPQTGPYMLHQGERVTKASDVANSTGITIGEVSVNLGGVRLDGSKGDAVEQLLKALDVNKGRIKERVRDAIVQQRRNLIIK